MSKGEILVVGSFIMFLIVIGYVMVMRTNYMSTQCEIMCQDRKIVECSQHTFEGKDQVIATCRDNDSPTGFIAKKVEK